MKILYIIALISFAALAGAAYAISRHVRRNAAAGRPTAAQDLELSQAIDVRLSAMARPPSKKASPAPPDPPVVSAKIEEQYPEDSEPEDDPRNLGTPGSQTTGRY